MKAHTVSNRYYASRVPGAHRYPNARVRKDIAHRIVDGLLSAAITLGAILIITVMVTL